MARSVTIWAANPANGDTVSLWTRLALEAAGRGAAPKAQSPVPGGVEGQGAWGTNLSLPPVAAQPGRPGGVGLPSCSVRGRLALGTIKAARDATFQAAFLLKGKPPNVYGFTVSKSPSQG